MKISKISTFSIFLAVELAWLGFVWLLAPRGGAFVAALLILGLLNVSLVCFFLHRREKQAQDEYEYSLVEQRIALYSELGTVNGGEERLSKSDMRMARRGYHTLERVDTAKDLPTPNWLPEELRNHW